MRLFLPCPHFRPEIEASVARAGTAAGLDFQDILAVIGCRGILLPGNGHAMQTLGVVVNHDTVVSVPESRVAVEHLPERHGRSEFLRRRDARSPLGGYGCGKGNRAGGISHEILPEAMCPDPSLFRLHFVELAIDPSLPSEMLFFQIWLWSKAHPAIRLYTSLLPLLV